MCNVPTRATAVLDSMLVEYFDGIAAATGPNWQTTTSTSMAQSRPIPSVRASEHIKFRKCQKKMKENFAYESRHFMFEHKVLQEKNILYALCKKAKKMSRE
jgi:hypothetical protein